LIIDYVVKEYRGRAIALSNMGIIVGDLLNFVVLMNIVKTMGEYNKFLTFTLTLAAFAVILFILIKEPIIDIEDKPKISLREKVKNITD
jgi:hypothetical protein